MQHPKNNAEAKTRMKEFSMAGLNGGLGSMDAAHIVIENSQIASNKIILVGNHH